MSSIVRLLSLVSIACSLIIACAQNDTTGPAAPIGAVEALEQLATAYRSVAQTLPGTPRDLPPPVKRKFVEQVFQQAGYDYSTTIITLSQAELDPFDSHQRDLAQLLFLPLEQLARENYDDYYSEPELAAIDTIKKTFK